MQGYGDVLVTANGWDPEVLARFRSDEFVTSFGGAFDAIGTTEDLERVATLLPEEWLDAAATGTATQCAERVAAQFDLGADGVVLHGATPAELDPVVRAYRGLRADGRFDGLPANPGLATAPRSAT